MSQEVASLVRQRAVIKSRLTNFKKFLDACTVDSLDDAAICELEQKVERINLANEEFAGIQCQIESLVEDLEEQITERDLVENSFDRYLGIAKSLLVNTKSEVRSGNSGRSSANSSRPSNSRYRGGGEGASVNVDIRLPKIELPKFSGDASSWVEFREIYNSLIHFNENISDIQKFHYLKAALQKDAANAIQCIDFTAANYKNAYDAVIERYDNVRLLTHNHVHAIFSISPITKETADEIRRIIDTVSKHLKSLEQLGEQVDTWDTLIIYVIASKLDKFSLREWEKYASHLSNKPNLKDIREFLKSRAGILEALEAKASQDRVGKGRQAASTSKGLVSTTGSKCLACDQNHSIQNCPAFQKLNVSQRYEKLKEKKACRNCLRLGHFSRQCRASRCKRCSAKHNTLLHFEKTNSSVPENSEQTPAAACLSSYATPDHALLSTTIVEISDKNGNPCQGRAVLDSGSQSNYITKEFCNRLGIPVTNVHFALSGINENALIAKAKCNVDLRSRINNFCRSLTFYVLPTITGDVPMIKVNRSELNVPKNIPLADPTFDCPGKIDMLIGVEIFYELLCIGQIRLGRGMPVLQKTVLGWLVSGPISSCHSGSKELKSICGLSVDNNVQQQLAAFWEMEEMPTEKPKSAEEEACEEHFAKTTKRKLGKEIRDSNPNLSRIILHDFYVDDMLTGCENFDEALDICKDIASVLKSGCFELRKWQSNSSELLSTLSMNNNEEHTLKFGERENCKTLGLVWMSDRDVLTYNIGKFERTDRTTKRILLSHISQVYDPLGLVSPCIIKAKIMLQLLWLEKVEWDETVSQSLHTSWCKLRDDLPSLNELAIPRKVISANAWKIELHGFSDSSKDAYGGCLYVRSIDKDGSIEVHLLCSKSKVAPLKTISIPRLELCAALVLSRLADKVRKSLNLTFDRCILWSDSSVVLGWLNHSPGALKTFVANRVSEIQTLTSDSQWRYIGTKDNPADLVSRGAYPHELSSKSIWWNGPEFISKPEACWPESKFTVPNLPEINVTSKTLVANSEFADSLFNRYSSLSKLKRVIAYIMRFRYLKSMAGTCKGSLTVVELNRALLCLVKLAQMSSFWEERRNLIKGTGLNPKSRLLNLSPFLDEHGVIRVGGRLKNSNYRFEKVHPTLLCSKHPLAVLIVKFEHQISYHAGPQALLAAVREKYWILSGRRLCKDIINKCVVCRKQKAQILSPIMGQLPKSRFDCNFPFEICGVDYAGPFLIKDRQGRGAKLVKCYVSLFICFASKAVHLELVSDLSTETFILALRRFVARRGKPKQINSDNGSNFIGANSELKELSSFLRKHSSSIIDACSEYDIEWRFIPAHSPHFGGLWEAGVKSVKHHLRRTASSANFTFEEFYSLLVQIEAILNSRPLCPLSTDPNDLAPLTPSHFLIGRTGTEIPDPDVTTINPSRLSRFQKVQGVKQHFWQRWSLEYVGELQLRKKWMRDGGPMLQPGMMVLIKEDNLPPSKWKLGRVLQVHAGRDGVARVATVKSVTGEIKRSFSKLCPLFE
nr:unnamed protein product [Callosobruchus analis]